MKLRKTIIFVTKFVATFFHGVVTRASSCVISTTEITSTPKNVDNLVNDFVLEDIRVQKIATKFAPRVSGPIWRRRSWIAGMKWLWNVRQFTTREFAKCLLWKNCHAVTKKWHFVHRLLPTAMFNAISFWSVDILVASRADNTRMISTTFDVLKSVKNPGWVVFTQTLIRFATRFALYYIDLWLISRVFLKRQSNTIFSLIWVWTVLNVNCFFSFI